MSLWRGSKPGDRTFLTHVLPQFTYDEYDVDADHARIRWFCDGAAVELDLDWNHNATHVAVVALPVNQDQPVQADDDWKLRTNGNGESRWAWFGHTISYIALEWPRPAWSDARVVAEFTVLGPECVACQVDQSTVNAMVRRILASCEIEPMTKLFPDFPEPSYRRFDLDFVDVKLMVHGLLKRNVI